MVEILQGLKFPLPPSIKLSRRTFFYYEKCPSQVPPHLTALHRTTSHNTHGPKAPKNLNRWPLKVAENQKLMFDGQLQFLLYALPPNSLVFIVRTRGIWTFFVRSPLVRTNVAVPLFSLVKDLAKRAIIRFQVAALVPDTAFSIPTGQWKTYLGINCPSKIWDNWGHPKFYNQVSLC